jgi:hypothetical protein
MPTQQIWFDVMPDRGGWAVRCQHAHFGRYRTQDEALIVAVTEARKVKDTKRLVQVRVLRESSKEDRYLSLL